MWKAPLKLASQAALFLDINSIGTYGISRDILMYRPLSLYYTFELPCFVRSGEEERPRDARKKLTEYFHLYNKGKFQQAPGYQTPAGV